MKLHPDYIYMWYKPQQGQTVNLPFVTRMPNGMYVHTINLYGETVGYPDNDTSRQYLLTKCSSMSSDRWFVGYADGTPLDFSK